MANISPCPFVVVPAVVKSENEEAAGIPRRPLSPALERVGGLPSRPGLRAQRPHVGVGGGEGEVPVRLLRSHCRRGRHVRAAESRTRWSDPRPVNVPYRSCVTTVLPFVLTARLRADHEGPSLPCPIPPRDRSGVKPFIARDPGGEPEPPPAGPDWPPRWGYAGLRSRATTRSRPNASETTAPASWQIRRPPR